VITNDRPSILTFSQEESRRVACDNKQCPTEWFPLIATKEGKQTLAAWRETISIENRNELRDIQIICNVWTTTATKMSETCEEQGTRMHERREIT